MSAPRSSHPHSSLRRIGSSAARKTLRVQALASKTIRNSSLTRSATSGINGTQLQRPALSIGPQENRGVICAAFGSHDMKRSVGLVIVNIAIADVIITEVSDTQFYPKMIHHMQMMESSTVLVPPVAGPSHEDDIRKHIEKELPNIRIVEMARSCWSQAEGMKYIRRMAVAADLPPVEFALEKSFYAVCAVSASMKYMQDEFDFTFDKNSVRFRYKAPADVMMISLPTIRSLEILENAQNACSKDSLFGILNRTQTAMGSRILRNNIIQPSTKPEILQQRYEAVQELSLDCTTFSLVEQEIDNERSLTIIALGALKPLGDLEKLITKLVILPKDGSVYESEQAINNILRLKTFLHIIPELFNALSNAQAPILSNICQTLHPQSTQDILELIDEKIDSTASHSTKPLEMRNQRIHSVMRRVSAALDIQRTLYTELTRQVQDYVCNLEGEHGIKLQLKYMESRRFYLRVSAKEIGKGSLPSVFINKTRCRGGFECQTLKLVQLNEQINRTVKSIIHESELVIRQLLTDIRPHVSDLFQHCESIAIVDLLQSFASLVRTHNYQRPEIVENFCLTEAKHPIIDYHGANKCIPNNYYVTEESRFQIITGQNMSGKSTYIRGIAMIQIMAQIGCFVPAESARLPIRHCLFARVSTEDNIEANMSTFSVEMREMAFILRNVTEKSLLIVDELGRATNTQDGLAIATAMSEALLQSKATVFFATHFLQLARGLAYHIGVANRHLMTESYSSPTGNSAGTTTKMLYKVGDGPEKQENYGLALARAIGFPQSFMAKAEAVAAELRLQGQPSQEERRALEEKRRQKLRRELVSQLRIAEQSDAGDDELMQYLRRVKENYCSKMKTVAEQGQDGDGRDVDEHGTEASESGESESEGEENEADVEEGGEETAGPQNGEASKNDYRNAIELEYVLDSSDSDDV